MKSLTIFTGTHGDDIWVLISSALRAGGDLQVSLRVRLSMNREREGRIFQQIDRSFGCGPKISSRITRIGVARIACSVFLSKRVDVSDDPIGEIADDTAEHFDHDHHATLQALRKMIRN